MYPDSIHDCGLKRKMLPCSYTIVQRGTEGKVVAVLVDLAWAIDSIHLMPGTL